MGAGSSTDPKEITIGSLNLDAAAIELDSRLTRLEEGHTAIESGMSAIKAGQPITAQAAMELRNGCIWKSESPDQSRVRLMLVDNVLTKKKLTTGSEKTYDQIETLPGALKFERGNEQFYVEFPSRDLTVMSGGNNTERQTSYLESCPLSAADTLNGLKAQNNCTWKPANDNNEMTLSLSTDGKTLSMVNLSGSNGDPGVVNDFDTSSVSPAMLRVSDPATELSFGMAFTSSSLKRIHIEPNGAPSVELTLVSCPVDTV